MKKALFAIFIIVMSVFSLPAAEFVRKDVDGTLHYQCNLCCNRVRVKFMGGGRYRVYAVKYAGMLTASDPLEAAKKACGEIPIEPE